MVESVDQGSNYSGILRGIAILFLSLFSTFSDLKDATAQQTSDQDMVDHLNGTMLFVFFHELGHALVHEHDLPIPGREEDIVDEFSTFLMLGMGQSDQRYNDLLLRSALNSLLVWQSKTEEELASIPFYDEHSLDVQRYFNVICLVYGSNPGLYWPQITNVMPEDRARECESEFARKAKTWHLILSAISPSGSQSFGSMDVYLDNATTQDSVRFATTLNKTASC